MHSGMHIRNEKKMHSEKENISEKQLSRQVDW